MLDRIATRSTGEYGDPEPETVLWAGTIAGPPDANDEIQVVVPGFHPELRTTTCPYMPRPLATPTRGDACLVGIDDNGRPWVIAWVPSP